MSRKARISRDTESLDRRVPVAHNGFMPAPTEGQIRVYPRHSVNGLRANRWQDVPAGDSRIEGFIAAGLVSLTGPRGEPAPEDIPPNRCCGSIRR